MSGILSLLGIDPEEIRWHDFAMCRGMDREFFYDLYESDTTQAKITDSVCLSCPVLKECLEAGIENSEYGVWGGIYLERGKPDQARNAHKSEETWNTLRERIGDIT